MESGGWRVEGRGWRNPHRRLQLPVLLRALATRRGGVHAAECHGGAHVGKGREGVLVKGEGCRVGSRVEGRGSRV